MSLASRASHGNEILTGMGKNRERVRFSPRPGHRDRPREAAIHCGRTYHAARRDGFQDYYAVKSHLAVARRLVAGCGNTCAAMQHVAGRCGAARRRTRNAPRSDAQRRGRRKTFVRRVCAAVPVAGGARLSRPYPRRARSDAPRRGRRGYFARRHAAYQPGPAELFRSEVARRHAGGPRLSRPCPCRARSDALRRVPSFFMREISVRNKISSMARTVISESVIAPVIK